MVPDPIKLNFLPLESQQFSFRVFRRPCAGAAEQRPDAGLYRNSLPKEADPEERADYWIAFEPRTGFDPFECWSEYNRRLTLHYLYHLLCRSVRDGVPNGEYALDSERYRRRVEVFMERHPEGDEAVWLEPYFLRSSGRFGFLLDFHFRKHPSVPFSRKVLTLSLSLGRDGKSNQDFYSDRFDKVRTFLNEYGSRVLSLDNGGERLGVSMRFERVPCALLASKRYLFGGRNECPTPYKGLDRFGPIEPVSSPLRFVLAYRPPDRALVTDLARALTGRLPEVPFKGLGKMFGIGIGKTCTVETSGWDARVSERIVEAITKASRADPESIFIPLVVMSKSEEDAYRYVKRDLLAKGYPVQVVTTELLRKKATFRWSVSNIALQIFAKAGGKPWQVVPSTEACLIFGIGQAHAKDSAGRINRYFAYCVCADSTGIYRHMDVLGSSADQDDYLEQLRQNVLRVLREEAGTAYSRCVLHVPFKVKRGEMAAIQDAIDQLQKELESDGTEFVVLRINADSKYFGYASTNSLVPYEGTYVRIASSPGAYLVWFEGVQPSNPSISRRIGGPIYIEFHWHRDPLSADDEVILLQDIFNLSGCNWRGFNARHLPISIYYCELIAEKLKLFGGQVAHLEHTEQPWFL